MDYIRGPIDQVWIVRLYRDAVAGITVAIALIATALSYAALMNLPPAYGYALMYECMRAPPIKDSTFRLYATLLPSIVYIIFGTSVYLNIGPVALVSLLMGSLYVRVYSRAQSVNVTGTAPYTLFALQ
jgi:MFS superfamily sulfate permease-like transporter